MSAADSETIARELPRVLGDAYEALTRARTAADGAAAALEAAAREHTDALSAARAAGLAGAADAETLRSDYLDAERCQHVTAHERRRAIEDHRSEIESLEDRVSRARAWLADACAGGASAESVAAAERAIDAAERRVYVERLLAEERGWIRRARSSAEARVVATAAPSETGDASSGSTPADPPKGRRGLPRDEAAPARSVHATTMDPELLDLIADQRADMEADERLPARRVARQCKRFAD